MNATELELVTDLATAGERYSPEQYAATKTAEADLAAMRQPITPEALTAAGWERTFLTGDEYWGLQPEDREQPTADIRLTPYGLQFYGCGGWHETNARNMYDLTELVRLLGGE